MPQGVQICHSPLGPPVGAQALGGSPVASSSDRCVGMMTLAAPVSLPVSGRPDAPALLLDCLAVWFCSPPTRPALLQAAMPPVIVWGSHTGVSPLCHHTFRRPLRCDGDPSPQSRPCDFPIYCSRLRPCVTACINLRGSVAQLVMVFARNIICGVPPLKTLVPRWTVLPPPPSPAPDSPGDTILHLHTLQVCLSSCA